FYQCAWIAVLRQLTFSLHDALPIYTTVHRRPECPASSSWQEFFSFEVGDGGIGQSQVHLRGPVPRDCLVGSGIVVLQAVFLRALSQGQGVGNVIEEEPLVLQRAEAAFAGTVLTGGVLPRA